MPTLTLAHEAPLELIRQYLGPTDMNNVIPVQFTADSVIVVSDAATGAPALIVIVEPQGRDDKTKQYAWPAYITNARRAAQCERAVLLMETETGARQVLAAIRDTRASDADRKRLTTIILKSASDAARQILRDMMTMTEWKDDFIESYVNVGLEQAKAEYVLKALDKRGLDLTVEQREQVSACTDLAQLDRWFDRALTAATTADVFND